MNPLLCERCGRDLETDDAISIIEGVCCNCRRAAARQQLQTGARTAPATPPPAAPRPPASAARPRPQPRQVDLPHVVPHFQHQPAVRPAMSRPAAVVDAPAPRMRRRRDLAIGVSLGLIVVAAMTGYMVTQRMAPVQLTLPGARAEALPVRLLVKPAWATVQLDGKPLSEVSDDGSLKFTLPPGEEAMHWLTVDAEGYHPVRRPVTAQAGVSDIVVELVQKPIELAVHSDPTEAEVWIDNQYKGNTPLTITMMPWEQSTLSLKRAGYAPISHKIAPPERGNRLELDFALDPAGVMVRVEVEPVGAIVTVDGRINGTAPLDIVLDESYRGREVEITASLSGYEQATLRTTLPDEISGEPVVASLSLARPQSHMVIRTDPPGADVLVAGKPIGKSPVTASFGPEQIGQRIAIEGRISGTHDGRSTVLVPPAGQSEELTLPLELVGQVAAILVLSPTGTGPDHVLLSDRVIDQIHRLDDRQRFCLVTCTVDGVEAWPGISETAIATSDNKIRAYDIVRALRPSARGPVSEAVSAVRALNPSTVWLFAGGKIRAADLDELGETVGLVVNIVQVGPRAAEPWLHRWVEARSGVLSVIEGSPHRLIAGDVEDAD